MDQIADGELPERKNAGSEFALDHCEQIHLLDGDGFGSVLSMCAMSQPGGGGIWICAGRSKGNGLVSFVGLNAISQNTGLTHDHSSKDKYSNLWKYRLCGDICLGDSINRRGTESTHGPREIRPRNIVNSVYSIAQCISIQENIDQRQEDCGEGKIPAGKDIIYGCSDRNMVLWKIRMKNSAKDENVDRNFPSTITDNDDHSYCCDFLHEKIGPHTGWVKDIVCNAAFLGSSGGSFVNFALSIGCNRIESWKRSQGRFEHILTQSVESCPSHLSNSNDHDFSKRASTLSSDLLCLCLASNNSKGMNETNTAVFAGGVDGRIHQWLLIDFFDKKKDTKPSSACAHGGRVTSLVFSPNNGFLFSASRDGTIQCRCISGKNCKLLSNQIQDIKNCPYSTITISGENISKDILSNQDNVSLGISKSSNCCITSMCLLHDKVETGISEVLVGTSSGNLFTVKAEINADILDTALKIEKNFDVDGKPVIHDIIVLEDENTTNVPVFVVGHSHGLSLIQM